MQTTDPALIRAVYDQRLYRHCAEQIAATPSPPPEVVAGRDTCGRIQAEATAMRENLTRAFSDAGVRGAFHGEDGATGGAQYRSLGFHLASRNLTAVFDIVRRHGFHIDPTLYRKAKALRSAAVGLDLMRWSDPIMRLQVTWPIAGLGPFQRLRPQPADISWVPIPNGAWPAYFAIRPLRRAYEKLTGVSVGDHLGISDPSSSLPTPGPLIEPLLEVVGLTSTDTLMDLGCGDGRILTAAARQTGCKAIGIERNAALVEIAQTQIRQAKVDHLAQVHLGDIASAPLRDATVIFLFVPRGLLNEMLHRIRQVAAPGTRILAHEQAELTIDWQPDRRVLILAETELTVASVWTVPKGTNST